MEAHTDSLIRPDLYQVFLLSCPANLPLSFAAHSWFVVNQKGSVSRWEVTFNVRKRALSWEHLNQNLFPTFSGIEIIPFFNRPTWRGTLLGSMEGSEGSSAQRMSDFIARSRETYPFYHDYFLTGPNSNTYTQWVLDRFPEFPARLPKNAFGRRYSSKSGMPKTLRSPE